MRDIVGENVEYYRGNDNAVMSVMILEEAKVGTTIACTAW